ncbi:nuclear transport factor 2 family protein [Streptomyces mirabilis]|uniref:nuclear transport factor 2 family protein n=1 Tax=Streptomyces mirabilis TaxID=68239 RepID=UPI00367AE583
MSTVEDKNKAIVREAFDTLFNRRDYVAAERFWSPDSIRHSARIAPGREGLFDLVKSLPAELKHECELIMAEGDMVMVRGRFSGHGQPAPWIAADFVRIGDGILVEHWDVIEEEASRKESLSGLPRYGDDFPEER